ncbi:hypothetical protein Tco_1420831 [Tanacetum coccineum]
MDRCSETGARLLDEQRTQHTEQPESLLKGRVDQKTSPRSDLRWKPTGRIFKSVGLRWIPIGKLFDSCTSKVDSEPTHGSNVDIPHIHECKQTLDENSELVVKRLISQKPLSKWIHR